MHNAKVFPALQLDDSRIYGKQETQSSWLPQAKHLVRLHQPWILCQKGMEKNDEEKVVTGVLE